MWTNIQTYCSLLRQWLSTHSDCTYIDTQRLHRHSSVLHSYVRHKLVNIQTFLPNTSLDKRDSVILQDIRTAHYVLKHVHDYRTTTRQYKKTLFTHQWSCTSSSDVSISIASVAFIPACHMAGSGGSPSITTYLYWWRLPLGSCMVASQVSPGHQCSGMLSSAYQLPAEIIIIIIMSP